MSTNNFFSAKRFGLVFLNDFLENKKLYILGLVFIYGVLLFLAIGVGTVAYKYVYDELLKGHVEWARTDYLYNEIKYCFMYGGIIVSCVVASFAFNKMKDKKGRIGNLTLPASQFEKYMVRWLVTVVFYCFWR